LVISEWEINAAILTKKPAAVRPFTNFLAGILAAITPDLATGRPWRRNEFVVLTAA
jgi:hypothetical protein